MEGSRHCIDFGIEDHLIESCSKNPEYEHLYSIWILEKKHLSQELEGIERNFPYFSSHDVSHSRAIISSIELLLGQDRIKSLTPTDAWLILQCAYKHDLGMLISLDDLKNFLSPQKGEIIKFIERCKYSQGDLRDAAFFVDGKLSKKMKDEYSNSKNTMDWPVQVDYYLKTLARAYTRENHHTRTKEKIYQNIDSYTFDGALSLTLVDLVALISESHNKNNSSVMDLPHEVKGAGRDYAHPRFIAMLLRIGDLLDMDSNRFSPFIHKYYGEMPFESLVHKIKHLSTRNIFVSPQRIDALALFDRKLIKRSIGYLGSSTGIDGDKYYMKALYRARIETKRWFGYLKDSVEWLALYWHDIVPQKFPGSAPLVGDLTIELDGYKLEDRDFELSFQISSYRAGEVLEGVGLYNEPLVFIRELVQNAWDATKKYVYDELFSVACDKILRQKIKSYKLLSPITSRVLELSKYISVELEVISEIIYDSDNQNSKKVKLKFNVTDKGIGIDNNALHYMKHIGDVYDPATLKRKDMPEWLKPTAAFGIGLQSVFMWVDDFTMRSKSRKDSTKRNITFYAPKFGGDIINEVDRDFESDGCYGTTVTIEFDTSYSDLFGQDTLLGSQSNPLSNSNISDPISTDSHWWLNRIAEYIKTTISHDIIPLRYCFQYIDIKKEVCKYEEGKYDGRIASIIESFSNNLNKPLVLMKNGSFSFLCEKEDIVIKGIFSKSNLFDLSFSTRSFGTTDIYFRGMKIDDASMSNELKQYLTTMSLYFLDSYTDKTLIINREKIKYEERNHIKAKASSAFNELMLAVLNELSGYEDIDVFNIEYYGCLYINLSVLQWKNPSIRDKAKHILDILASKMKHNKLAHLAIYNESVEYKADGWTRDKVKNDFLGCWFAPRAQQIMPGTLYNLKDSKNQNLELVNEIALYDEMIISFSCFYKKIKVLRLGNLSTWIYKISPERNESIDISIDEYWEIVIGLFDKNSLENTNSYLSDETHLLYVFPVCKQYREIAIKQLPFRTKNEQILRYSCYILSPFDDIFVTDLLAGGKTSRAWSDTKIQNDFVDSIINSTKMEYIINLIVNEKVTETNLSKPNDQPNKESLKDKYKSFIEDFLLYLGRNK